MKYKVLFESTDNLNMATIDICNTMNKLNIKYALIGGLCLPFYGFNRFTHDIDILIDKSDYKILMSNILGRGYLPKFEGSKGIKNTMYKIPIDFIFNSEKYGNFTYPNPKDVRVKRKGIYILDLVSLIEIKLASGLNNKKRTHDIADAHRIIKYNIDKLNNIDNISKLKNINDKYIELRDIENE